MTTNTCKPGPVQSRLPTALVSFLRQEHLASLCVLLFILTAWTFLPCLGHDFISYDDRGMVTENLVIQSGLNPATLKWCFCNPVLGNWHPLTCLSHALDCQIYGLEPWGHHLTSVLLHSLNTVLTFVVFLALTGAPVRSVFIALLFGLHPLRVESVAWVAERKDVLGASFWLFTIWAYTFFARSGVASTRRRAAWYLLTLALYCLGLLSKPSLVTLPFLLLLLDYWPLHRMTRQRLWPVLAEKIPFLILSAADCVITLRVQHQSGDMPGLESLPIISRLENSLISYCRYLGKIVWPQDLCLPYPYPGHWPVGLVVGAAMLIGTVSLLCCLGGRRHPYLPVGWFWYLGTLVPVIGMVQVGVQSMADRHAYIPTLGVLLMLAWGMVELTRKYPWQRAILPLLTSGLVLACVGATRAQLSYWKNTSTLFRHSLAVSKNNKTAAILLADDLGAQGKFHEALGMYRSALAMAPFDGTVRNNYGLLLQQQGRLDEAINQFEEGVRLNPNRADLHLNLGAALERKGFSDAANREYRLAFQLAPDSAATENNFGVSLAKEGHPDSALLHFEQALRLDPRNASAHANIGIILQASGKLDEAAAHLQQALSIEPDFVLAHAKLAQALASQSRCDLAAQHYQACLRLNPQYAQGHYEYGKVLLKLNRREEARAQFSEALKLQPGLSAAETELRALTQPPRAAPSPPTSEQ